MPGIPLCRSFAALIPDKFTFTVPDIMSLRFYSETASIYPVSIDGLCKGGDKQVYFKNILHGHLDFGNQRFDIPCV